MNSNALHHFEFIEVLPISSKIGQDNILHILEDSGFWKATIQSYNSTTGEYKIILQGNLLSTDNINPDRAE